MQPGEVQQDADRYLDPPSVSGIGDVGLGSDVPFFSEPRALTSADFGIPDPHQRAETTEGAPTVFMEALRGHTYHGRSISGPSDDGEITGDVYLAHEHEVENIENLRFARRIPPPPRAVRPR